MSNVVKMPKARRRARRKHREPAEIAGLSHDHRAIDAATAVRVMAAAGVNTILLVGVGEEGGFEWHVFGEPLKKSTMAYVAARFIAISGERSGD